MVQLERCVAEPLQTITGLKWSWLLFRVVLQDARSEVMKVYPPWTLKVVVDYNKAFMEGRNKELPCIQEKVLKAK